ncbi:MAG: hypothetical protein ABI147_10670 [Acidobacteriaceae bacterium]
MNERPRDIDMYMAVVYKGRTFRVKWLYRMGFQRYRACCKRRRDNASSPRYHLDTL